MLYIVHVLENQSKRSFSSHKSAFQTFKVCARQNKSAALWHCDAKGRWTIVHHSGFYPTAMTQPPSMLYDSHKGVA